MRLLFCTTDGAGAFNGINAWLLDFLPALAAADHEPSVLVFPWSHPETCTTYPQFRAAGVDAHAVFPMLYTEAAVRCCVREVARTRADVFVANMVTPALLAMPRVRALGVPCISVLHNDDDEYRAKAAFRADATIAISHGLVPLIPADGRIARCIPYGVPPSPRVAAAPSPGQPLRLVYHGRIACHQKRIIETAAALARVCRTHSHVRADVYGSGPDEAALQAQLGRDDAGGRVRFLGPRSPAGLRELLPDYHVSVLLSDFEGLGLSVLEAMSAGLVPVCLRTGSGLPDIIRHDENGWFVSDREAGFDAAITRLATDEAEWSRLARGALVTARASFSPDACIRVWQSLLREMTGRSLLADTAPCLPPPLPSLVSEDHRHPGLPRALWRWLRFGRVHARRPW